MCGNWSRNRLDSRLMKFLISFSLLSMIQQIDGVNIPDRIYLIKDQVYIDISQQF
jgi:hypothetical protein